MTEFAHSDLARRQAQMIHFGVVDTVDFAAGTARVRIGDLLTAPLPMMATRAGADRSWWPFEAGEQVCVLAPCGNLSAGLIIGAIYSGSAPAPGDRAGLARQVFEDGTVVEYDREASHFRMSIAAGTAEINAPGGVSISGNVTVQGDVVADGISLKSHVHGGVLPGGGNTGGPQ